MTDEQDLKKTRSSIKRPAIRQSDYERLSEFRHLIRLFLEFSQEKARLAGLTPRHHQALLAIKGYPGGGPVTVGKLAERLRIRHHSAVELVDRICEAGLITRDQDKTDHRRVVLNLTPRAEEHLADLSAAHLDELDRIEPMLRRLLRHENEADSGPATETPSMPQS